MPITLNLIAFPSQCDFNHSSGREDVMPVTEYLEHARECAELAERMPLKDKKKILEIADAWLKLADEAAKEAAQTDAKRLTPKTP
jgi:hypothetical protein